MANTLTTSRTDPLSLPLLAQRLKAWRSTRIRGQRIPEELWKGAVDLARVHGLNPTVAALKINYYGLQRRLLVNGVHPRRRRIPSPFVEVAAPLLPALARGTAEQGTFELVQPSGARLTLRLPNARPKDLVPLVHLFLRHRS